MEHLDTSSEAMRSIMEKIEKLLRLANNNDNEHQAAQALAKANEYLAQYNLDVATVERHSGETGKREEQRVMGGMHVYQRNLWRSIAELNFCFYWTMKVRAKEGSLAAKRKRRFTHEHKLIGRVVNVRATQNMADYLEKTIERLCRDRLGGDAGKQFYSSDAVSYREGIADRVIEKVNDRRWEMITKERRAKAEREKAARESGRADAVTGTAITLFDYSQQENDANTDFIYGEGYSAKERADRARYAQERAETKAREEAEYTAWAKDNPELARQKEEEARKEREKNEARWSRRRYREPKERKPGDMNAYYAGLEAGEKVSIDQQVSDGANVRRIK
jgi:hypothetical protein